MTIKIHSQVQRSVTLLSSHKIRSTTVRHIPRTLKYSDAIQRKQLFSPHIAHIIHGNATIRVPYCMNFRGTPRPNLFHFKIAVPIMAGRFCDDSQKLSSARNTLFPDGWSAWERVCHHFSTTWGSPRRPTGSSFDQWGVKSRSEGVLARMPICRPEAALQGCHGDAIEKTRTGCQERAMERAKRTQATAAPKTSCARARRHLLACVSIAASGQQVGVSNLSMPTSLEASAPSSAGVRSRIGFLDFVELGHDNDRFHTALVD